MLQLLFPSLLAVGCFGAALGICTEAEGQRGRRQEEPEVQRSLGTIHEFQTLSNY